MQFSKDITRKIKATVMAADSNAQVILYGSQARGTAMPESDWDILILVNRPKITVEDERFFRHLLFDVELETEQSISTYVYSVNDWNSRMSVTPLYSNILKEGIRL